MKVTFVGHITVVDGITKKNNISEQMQFIFSSSPFTQTIEGMGLQQKLKEQFRISVMSLGDYAKDKIKGFNELQQKEAMGEPLKGSSVKNSTLFMLFHFGATFKDHEKLHVKKCLIASVAEFEKVKSSDMSITQVASLESDGIIWITMPNADLTGEQIQDKHNQLIDQVTCIIKEVLQRPEFLSPAKKIKPEVECVQGGNVMRIAKEIAALQSTSGNNKNNDLTPRGAEKPCAKIPTAVTPINITGDTEDYNQVLQRSEFCAIIDDVHHDVGIQRLDCHVEYKTDGNVIRITNLDALSAHFAMRDNNDFAAAKPTAVIQPTTVMQIPSTESGKQILYHNDQYEGYDEEVACLLAGAEAAESASYGFDDVDVDASQRGFNRQSSPAEIEHFPLWCDTHAETIKAGQIMAAEEEAIFSPIEQPSKPIIASMHIVELPKSRLGNAKIIIDDQPKCCGGCVII